MATSCNICNNIARFKEPGCASYYSSADWNALSCPPLEGTVNVYAIA